MKKVFITGGSGTVGSAFIERNYNKYKFYSYSRNEKQQVALKRRFPNVEIVFGTIEDLNHLTSEILKASPDIIIHAAALKHIDTAEKQPHHAISVNLFGSANIVEAARTCNVPITIGISTDKACKPDSVYGYTKLLMEKLFSDADNSRNRFACCRFGNVAGSHGSVIPFWLGLNTKGQKLKLTDAHMNRLMFLPQDSAELIEKTIELSISSEYGGGFVLSKKMKNVNMLNLSRVISPEVEIVGLRPGEKLDEDLISEKEAEYSQVVLGGDYILLSKEKNKNKSTRLEGSLDTTTAKNMTTKELEEMVDQVKTHLSSTLLLEGQY